MATDDSVKGKSCQSEKPSQTTSLSSSKGLNFFLWIQILILNYFQPPLKISLTSVMQLKKEQAKGAAGLRALNWSVRKRLSARSEEADLNGSIKARKKISSSREVHFTLNPFLFLALPLPHSVSLFLSFHFPFSFCLHLSPPPLFLSSSRQMVNHTMQFCSISRALSYHNSPIIIKSE